MIREKSAILVPTSCERPPCCVLSERCSACSYTHTLALDLSRTHTLRCLFTVVLASYRATLIHTHTSLRTAGSTVFRGAALDTMSTKKRDELLAIQEEMQHLWDDTKVFEVDAPLGEGKAKAEWVTSHTHTHPLSPPTSRAPSPTSLHLFLVSSLFLLPFYYRLFLCIVFLLSAAGVPRPFRFNLPTVRFGLSLALSFGLSFIRYCHGTSGALIHLRSSLVSCKCWHGGSSCNSCSCYIQLTHRTVCSPRFLQRDVLCQRSVPIHEREVALGSCLYYHQGWSLLSARLLLHTICSLPPSSHPPTHLSRSSFVHVDDY